MRVERLGDGLIVIFVRRTALLWEHAHAWWKFLYTQTEESKGLVPFVLCLMTLRWKILVIQHYCHHSVVVSVSQAEAASRMK